VPGRLKEGQQLVDLVRVDENASSSGFYDGICW
jgi:hypothetical protein